MKIIDELWWPWRGWCSKHAHIVYNLEEACHALYNVMPPPERIRQPFRLQHVTHHLHHGLLSAFYNPILWWGVGGHELSLDPLHLRSNWWRRCRWTHCPQSVCSALRCRRIQPSQTPWIDWSQPWIGAAWAICSGSCLPPWEGSTCCHTASQEQSVCSGMTIHT